MGNGQNSDGKASPASNWGSSETSFFYQLTPDTILDAVENLGFRVTGRCLTLNSMENRVYEIEIEEAPPGIELPLSSSQSPSIIAKFYRPGRWSREQILEEHEFLLDLVEDEIPAIAPFRINRADSGGPQTLFDHEGLFYCVFPKRGGRSPQEMTDEQIEMTGRLLARMHNVGARKQAKHRLHISTEVFGQANLQILKESHSIDSHLESGFESLVMQICDLLEEPLSKAKSLRIHGDCHWGNMILRDPELSFIDFDDMLVGPAVQDIWLVEPGIDQEAKIRRSLLIEAYQSFRDFDFRELKLIEGLRALRYIHFAAWISKRWQDPAFQRAFPHFKDRNYWEIICNDLRTQVAKLQEDLNAGQCNY